MKSSGERDVVMSTDEPESAIAAIRRMTARTTGSAAFDAATQQGADTRPPAPTTVDEARCEAMGVLLGVIDTASALVPPPDVSGAQAMLQWSVMVEQVAYQHYGAAWSSFVEHVRLTGTPRAN